MNKYIKDSLGWHDYISVHITRLRNNISKRDIVPCVSLFSKVCVEEDDSMHYFIDHCKKDETVTLRTEMDIIFIVSNTLDSSKEYPSVPIIM